MKWLRRRSSATQEIAAALGVSEKNIVAASTPWFCNEWADNICPNGGGKWPCICLRTLDEDKNHVVHPHEGPHKCNIGGGCGHEWTGTTTTVNTPR